ncbi:MAG: hypothetical protein ACE3JK_15575 [Sporolactobacillus sp.]
MDGFSFIPLSHPLQDTYNPHVAFFLNTDVLVRWPSLRKEDVDK